MHPEYFETRFRVASPPPEWPSELAIVSAFATTGERWTEEENARAHHELERELRQRSVWMREVTGFSPRTGHAEPSYAIEIPLADARELGQRFRQDAIYYVQADQLFVTSCDPPLELVHVGRFRERVEVEANGRAVPRTSDASPPGDAATHALRRILKSQYHASLAMLREAVERCPEDLWEGGDQPNAFWQVAYHVLFYTHLYLQPNEAAFRPWEGHQAEVQHADAISGSPDPASDLPLLPRPYSRAEVLAYWSYCDAMVDGSIDAMDLDSPESGFWWYEMPKLEHQLVNLRHVAHHTAQLADRLRTHADIGISWVKARR